MSFDEIVHLDREQAAVIGNMLDRAAMAYEHVRVAIDEGGLKLAIGHQSWTPAIGRSSDELGSARSIWEDNNPSDWIMPR